MDVLIVESQLELATIWKRHLERCGMNVSHVSEYKKAIAYLETHSPQVIVLNLILEEGHALALADYTNYSCPEAQIIFVTNTGFFSDGSIFAHVQNACAFVQCNTPPADLAAMVEHYARPGRVTAEDNSLINFACAAS